jgi:hypothetical protein
MMPINGITFIVHILVVSVKKIAVFFGIKVKPAPKLGPVPSLVISIVIPLLVVSYVSFVVYSFVKHAANDHRATWHLVSRTYQRMTDRFSHNGFESHQIQLPFIYASAVASPPLFARPPNILSVQNSAFLYSQSLFVSFLPLNASKAAFINKYHD